MTLARAHGYDPVPQTSGIYAETSNRTKVFRLLLAAFIVQFVSKWNSQKLTAGDAAGEAHRVVLATNIFGWMVLWFILTMVAEYDTTTDLALAFCSLLLIAQLLSNGTTAFTNTTTILTTHEKTQPPDPSPPITR
jgi:hypothetical protein